MNFCFFSTAICTIFESTSEEYLPNSLLSMCGEHFNASYMKSYKESVNVFNKEIIDDCFDLTAQQINTLKNLLFACNLCNKCMYSMENQKIFCKKCSSSQDNLDLGLPCKLCKQLKSYISKLAVTKAFIKKIIKKKYANIEIRRRILSAITDHFNYSVIFIILSELNFNFEQIKTLNNLLSVEDTTKYALSNQEIGILNTFSIFHEKMNVLSPKSLLEFLIDNNQNLREGFLYYIALRFNLKFYSEISSRHLFDIIKFAITAGTKFDFTEFDFFMKDLFRKIDMLGFILDKKDFLELIDVLAENQISQKYLVKFLENQEYFDMLTEDKMILILMKIFNIESIESACLAKNLSIFNNFDDDVDDQKKKEFLQQEISIPSSTLTRNYLDSMTEEYGEIYEKYQEIIKKFFKTFTNFTPNGQVKIACIIFSLLNPENLMVKAFRDLLLSFYSTQNFNNLDVLQVSDIIKLHLIYNVPFHDFEFAIKSIFKGIKKENDLDILFDHVFNAPNKETMVDIFVKICDKHSLSNSKLNQLIEYALDELNNGKYDLFSEIYFSCIKFNTNLQIKYFPKLLNQLDIEKHFYISNMDQGVYAHFSKKDLDVITQFSMDHYYFWEIIKFIEYLDYDQLESINKRKFDLITKKTDNSIKFSQEEIFKYLGTPFSYRILEYYISAIFSHHGKSENDFYDDILVKEVLLNPLFQKFYDDLSQEGEIFDNEYMERITNELLKFNKTHPKAWKVFFDNLSLKQQINVKTKIIRNINELKRNNKKTVQRNSVDMIHVKDLLKRCLDIPLESKIDFFLENFDSENYSLAKKLPEELKKSNFRVRFKRFI